MVCHSLRATLVILGFVVDYPEDILSDSVSFKLNSYLH